MDKKRELLIEKKVEKEVKKRLHQKIYLRTRAQAVRFRQEFKKQMLTAVSAALGFLIALSWREPISNFVKIIIERLGLSEGAIYFEFVSAIVVTIIAVLGLIFVSKWASKN